MSQVEVRAKRLLSFLYIFGASRPSDTVRLAELCTELESALVDAALAPKCGACGGKGRKADLPSPECPWPRSKKPCPACKGGGQGGVAAIKGQWPGDESEREILDALKGGGEVGK